MPDVPVRLKLAPLATLKFFAVVRVIAKPPLFKVPDCTLIFPVTLVGVTAALSVAPLKLVLLMLILL